MEAHSHRGRKVEKMTDKKKKKRRNIVFQELFRGTMEEINYMILCKK